jgi:hypothetical protein
VSVFRGYDIVVIAPFNLAARDGASIRVINMARAVAGLFDRVIIFFNSYINEFFNRSSIKCIKLNNIASRYHYIATLGMLIEPKLTSKLASRMLHIDAEYIKKP